MEMCMCMIFFQILLKFQMTNTGQLLNYFWTQKLKNLIYGGETSDLLLYCYHVIYPENT